MAPPYGTPIATAGSTVMKTEAEAGAEIQRRGMEPRMVDIGGGKQVFVAPDGLKVQHVKPWLDKYLERPERRRGTAVLVDLESFVAHVCRFKDDDSALFVESDSAAPRAKVTCILDYHRVGATGETRWGQHRSSYDFPFSDEWKAWCAWSGKQLDQTTFARLLEDRVADVADPSSALPSAVALAKQLGVEYASPSKLLTLSAGIEINVGRKITQSQKLQSGETRLHFEESHTGEDGGPVAVPGAFLLGIPVFKGGDVYQIPARLRYSASGTSVTWKVELYRLDLSFESALRESCKLISEGTKLPLYRGTPERGAKAALDGDDE